MKFWTIILINDSNGLPTIAFKEILCVALKLHIDLLLRRYLQSNIFLGFFVTHTNLALLDCRKFGAETGMCKCSEA